MALRLQKVERLAKFHPILRTGRVVLEELSGSVRPPKNLILFMTETLICPTLCMT